MTLMPQSLPAVRDVQLGGADFVPHLEAVHRLMDAARETRNGERDALLVAVLFNGCGTATGPAGRYGSLGSG